MSLIRSILSEALGLFIDDGSLALQIAALITFLTALVHLASLGPLIAALLLLAGCGIILVTSVLRRARR
ncbi:hypothetical protein [Loktanella sp. M215]|uniref:hypothetical protein n=1 Tax=Loktanella sp. M215 TaxID=2675431 RepID=UPI001F1B04DB|nr:hypothetical protein [Loktanella sp. M215]MCF7699397.1 hypothetical protein [Loktanella sp. M215]